MDTNLQIKSNLYAIEKARDENKEMYKLFPGDYLKLIYPQYTDSRNQTIYMTDTQVDEMNQYLLCIKCNRVCAGFCSHKSDGKFDK